jgi:GrpB-like predicted nucleotidyltransferase (UPF0157 family)
VTEVTLVERYNPEWPNWFLQLHALLGRTLAGHFYAIEHVGSTAVPGMTAKPIIDIDVVMRDGQFERIQSYLAPLGYVHEGDLGIPGREAFKLTGALVASLPSHHLYVLDRGAEELRRHLAFRHYLRSHSDEAQRLSEHKWQLAQRFDNDKERYIEAKAAMVQEILERALTQQGAPA